MSRLLTQPRARRAMKALFWFAIAVTFACAVAPQGQDLHLVGRDKVEHFLAFFTLTVLATAAYPPRSLVAIGLMLMAFGAAIELVQATPMVGRDGDFADIIADALAIWTAGAVMGFSGTRRRLLRATRPEPQFVRAVHGR